MITEKDLQEAIAECQGVRNPNSATCLKLAAYYTIQDHITEKIKPVAASYSYATEMPRLQKSNAYESGSEFFETVKNKDMNKVLSVMDELMDTLRAINPKLYEGVMSKLLI